MRKKILSVCLALLIIQGEVSPAIAVNKITAAEDAFSYAQYMENITESNDYMVEIINYISDSDGNLPDYYGGTCYDTCGNLVVHLTVTGDDDLKSALREKFPGCIFDIVLYSINELMDYQGEFSAMDIPFERMSINTYTNHIDVYFKTASQLKDADSRLSEYSFYDAFTLYLYESDNQILNNSIEATADELFPAGEIAAYEEKLSTVSSASDEVLPVATTSIQPGAGYSVTRGGDPVGTIGICAILSTGEYVAITHGHDLDGGEPVYIGTKKVGIIESENIYYNSDCTGYDFSYFEVSSSYVSSELATGTGSLTKTYTESQLVSMGYVTAAYIGNSSGSPDSYSIQVKIVTDDEDYPYLIFNQNTYDGDSGGPIYLETSSQTVFLGIVKGNAVVGVGVPASTIKSEIGLYYYFN